MLSPEQQAPAEQLAGLAASSRQKGGTAAHPPAAAGLVKYSPVQQQRTQRLLELNSLHKDAGCCLAGWLA